MNIRFLPAEATMSAPGLRLFLSTVTSEFGPHRLAMKSILVGPKIEVKEQGDFINCGVDTLAMLDEYIAHGLGCGVSRARKRDVVRTWTKPGRLLNRGRTGASSPPPGSSGRSAV